MGPPRRALSPIGPPPAPSAALARATKGVSFGSLPPLSSLPSTGAPVPSLTSPSEILLSREDRRNRRASTALRSLVDDSLLLQDGSSDVAVSAQNDDGRVDKKKLTKLTTLENCVIYVDVKMEDGAEAGQLFVNMLNWLGARVGFTRSRRATPHSQPSPS